MGQNSGLLSSLTDWNSTLAGYADSISSGVVMPIALTVLALFMVLELYNFTQTIAMNGGSTAFTIQQVALVMLKITLCRWAVLHSTEILNAMFEVAATVTNGIAGYVGSGQVNTEVDIENAISALPGGIGNMPVAMELMVVSWMLRLVNIVINTIVAARFIGFPADCHALLSGAAWYCCKLSEKLHGGGAARGRSLSCHWLLPCPDSFIGQWR